MNSPWTDDELMQELAAALAEEPVDESVVRAGAAALSWRTLDADLVLLELDSASAPAAGALVRGADPGAPRALAFHGEQLTVEIEIDEAGIVGQLTPPESSRVTMVTANGPAVTTEADGVGCFAFPLPAPGPMRLDCRQGDVRFVTEWVTVLPG